MKLKDKASKLSFVIDAFINRLGQGVSWLTALLVILVCLDVMLRYAFNWSKNWILELEWHIFSILFLFGASYTLLYDKHVRVDLFYERWSKTRQNKMNAIGILFFLIPWCVVLMDTTWNYAMNSLSFGEGSSQPNGLPARYIIKFCIFAGILLLLIQGFSELIRSLIRNKN